MANKAVLIDVNTYIADNGIRRNVASFRVNAQSADNSVVTRDATVDAAGGTFNYTSISGNVLTEIRTSKPVTMEVNQGSTTFSVVINSLFIITDSFVSAVFTNDGLDPAQLTIIQI